MQGRVWMHSAKKIKLFYNIQYRDTWHSWFTMFFLWRGLEQHVFSRGRMGCAWLPLSVSPEKCSLISSQLAATQGQRSIDNQSILQLVNCPGCWLGALGALSTSAGRDNSSSPPPPLPASLQLLLEGFGSSAWIWNRVSVHGERGGDCSYFTPLTRLHIIFVIGALCWNLFCYPSLCLVRVRVSDFW